MADWQRARIIPVSGIGSQKEAEARATSALLAVVEAVRDLSVALLSPAGASRAQKAQVRCYTEVSFKVGKSTVRPDGLIQVKWGKSTWTALVEVKTGTAGLNVDQVNAYWDIARLEGFDAVLTISNEIAAAPNQHPLDGLKVRANSRVAVHHYSWAALLSMCEVIRVHRGVEDPDQAWILSELIRYLQHPNSGADAFEDMGPEWVAVRDGARDKTLARSDPAVLDIATRWDQLIRFAALQLEANIGEPVVQVIPTAQQAPKKRQQHLVDGLVSSGQMEAVLRIPNTAGDLYVSADLRTRRILTAVTVASPSDRGARARCTWLSKQLDTDVNANLIVEAIPKGASTGTVATLDQFRLDKDCLIDDKGREPTRFRLSWSKDMGVARKTSKSSAGFIESVLGLITDFYGTVVEDLSAWSPKAPKISRNRTAMNDVDARPADGAGQSPPENPASSADAIG